MKSFFPRPEDNANNPFNNGMQTIGIFCPTSTSLSTLELKLQYMKFCNIDYNKTFTLFNSYKFGFD